MSVVTVENLELSQIVPSTTNPRKSFDQVALEQLAESIQEIGVTVPILVRMKRDVEGNVELDELRSYLYELVSGHRRLKACEIAGLETIPAFIRELSDAEALDIQMVENLQRADLHPMDEAAGYQALIDAAADRGVALTQQELAHKVGKPLSYVAQRVKLLDLTETPRKVFQEGHINIGHALILARLTPALQADGLRAIFDGNKNFAKVKDVAEVVEKAIRQSSDPKQYGGPREAARPVSQLKSWVKHEVELDLFQAPWDLNATNLHPTAASCLACPKRSGNNPALFSELTAGEDKCMDPECFDVKTKTFVHITVTGPTATGKPMLRLSHNWAYDPLDGTEKAIKEGQWVEAKPKSCPDAREGVMVQGNKTGVILWVCIDQKCKVHKHTVNRPQEARETASSGHTIPKGMTKPEYEAARKIERDREQAETTAIYMAIRAKAMKVKRDVLLVDFVALSLDNDICTDMDVVLNLNEWMTPKLARDYVAKAQTIEEKLRSLTGAAFNALIFDLTYGDISDVDCYRNDISKVVGDLMKTYEVDEKAVIAKVKADSPELYEEPKPKEEKAKPAPKKAAKKAAKKTAAKKAAKPTGKSAAANDLDDEDLDKLAVALSTDEPDTCKFCRCTDAMASEGGCRWANTARTVCSSADCVEKFETEGGEFSADDFDDDDFDDDEENED